MSATKTPSKRFKWSLESTRFNRSVATSEQSLASPPGYSISNSMSSSEVTKKSDPTHLIKKKSWELALAPIKQLPMNLFIMYMAGNSISIFPIMMVGMLFMRPIQAFFTINRNTLNLGLALYKCQSMGLLPTHSSDWLAFVEPQIRQEYLGGGISML